MRIPPVESAHHDEALLDQAVAETFPASDPISPAVAAYMEPGDARRDENLTNGAARFTRRFGRNAPALIAIGTAAVALFAMRALRGRRDRDRQYDYE
jgi:hypothetical protein